MKTEHGQLKTEHFLRPHSTELPNTQKSQKIIQIVRHRQNPRNLQKQDGKIVFGHLGTKTELFTNKQAMKHRPTCASTRDPITQRPGSPQRKNFTLSAAPREKPFRRGDVICFADLESYATRSATPSSETSENLESRKPREECLRQSHPTLVLTGGSGLPCLT